MIPPVCPKGHGSMVLVHVTQGEGKEETDLGYCLVLCQQRRRQAGLL
jgi:hypothetical protein